MHYLYIATLLALVLSFVKDSKKTVKAIKLAGKKLTKILPAFVLMLILVSVVLFLVPDKMIVDSIGNKNNLSSLFLSSFFGSITIMPGFIAFPLAGIMLKKGVGYMVLSGFTTTLMMVGIITYPLEKEYFGARATILRNCISFLIAIMVAITIGFFFGEFG
jgi:uncharacterized membrane protein YraQ (UPF0718 family)